MKVSLNRSTARSVLGVLGTTLAATVASLSFGTIAARAEHEETEIPMVYGTPADVIEQEFFHDGKDGFENMTYKEQWRSIAGTGHHRLRERGNFPEIAIERDLQRVNAVWEDAMAQQAESDPIIRVPDLANPYNTSLMMLPVAPVGSRVMGTEFVYERVPGR
ncbi:MAG: hypothetical protein ACO4CG_02960 [Prochlorothrix sp.]|nr:hypothetical protein [Prochlorothrix sp.]